MKLVGKVSEMFRYPIKSFAGESLNTCKLESYGLFGDRFYAFHDETKEGWESFITARQIPNMLTYQAKLVDEEAIVTSSDGRTFRWDEDLLAEIQEYTKKKVFMKDYKAPNPEDSELFSVDSASILIITDGTLRKLEGIIGTNLDMRRFRPNVVIALDDSSLDESDWIGKSIMIGETELQIDCLCQRCSIITLDPDTIDRDPSILKVVNQEFDLYFGLYASVKKTGEMKIDDTVYLLD